MQRIGRENTAPELAVRRYLHRAGLRFVLHDRSLPGTPDIVLPARGTVVFVHGCFWHGHSCGHGRVAAKTNAEFWATKISDNRERDRRKSRALRALGWRVEHLWECQCRNPRVLDALCRRLLGSPRSSKRSLSGQSKRD